MLRLKKQQIEQMSGDELIRLAKALKVPITTRKVQRDFLIDTLYAEFSERLKERDHEPARLSRPAVSLKNMSKLFGKKVAVKNLDLDVNPGEIVGLVGPNGAGKTTTLRVLTGIIRPTKGTVHVNGYDMRREPVQAKHRVGYIPERPTCYPSLRVREYLSFMARIYGVPQDEALVRMSEFINMLQLNEFQNMFIGNLSKGNLQRTLLAGIFVREPPFILTLDEPIYGLDPRGAWALKAHIRKLRDEGSAILISTHILEVAQALCDRFVIMDKSEVVGKGTLDELYERFPKASSLEEVFLALTGGIPES